LFAGKLSRRRYLLLRILEDKKYLVDYNCKYLGWLAIFASRNNPGFNPPGGYS
jgi:hypothetical protein